MRRSITLTFVTDDDSQSLAVARHIVHTAADKLEDVFQDRAVVKVTVVDR